MKLRNTVGMGLIGAALVGLSGCGSLPSVSALVNPFNAWPIFVSRNEQVYITYIGWGAKLQVASLSNKLPGGSWHQGASYHAGGSPVRRGRVWSAGPLSTARFDGFEKVVVTWEQGRRIDRLTEIYRVRPGLAPRLVAKREHAGF